MKYSYGKTILFILMANFISTAAFASNMSKPNKCPSVSALHRIHLEESDLIEDHAPYWTCCTASGFPYLVDGEWSLRKYLMYFDTDRQWDVGTSVLRGASIKEAVVVANKIFSSLEYYYGPVHYMNHWICDYGSPQGSVGVDTKD